jgi:predicted dehydrogenase
MLDDFSHVVDTARWVCGGDVVEVDSTCQRINSPDINWINASLKFDNGSTATLFGNWTSGRRVFRVNMQGNGVCADVEPENEAHVFAAGDYTGTRYDTKEVAGSDDLLVYGGFRQKSVEFIQAIQQGTKEGTSSPFQDVVKTMEVCEIILAQALLQGS